MSELLMDITLEQQKDPEGPEEKKSLILCCFYQFFEF